MDIDSDTIHTINSWLLQSIPTLHDVLMLGATDTVTKKVGFVVQKNLLDYEANLMNELVFAEDIVPLLSDVVQSAGSGIQALDSSESESGSPLDLRPPRCERFCVTTRRYVINRFYYMLPTFTYYNY